MRRTHERQENRKAARQRKAAERAAVYAALTPDEQRAQRVANHAAYLMRDGGRS